MELNADFSQRVLVHSDALPWTESPMKGVHRRMLDRIGDEVARATSIVRYAPGSHFSPHVHGGGEEFFVLDGVFQDEHGDYPAGSYIRNPPTSEHTPRSADGCIILVKLWQFDPSDRTPVRTDMNVVEAAEVAGVKGRTLFEDAREIVRVEEWAPGAEITRSLDDGGEFFVLEGGFSEGDDTLTRHSWLRIPRGGTLRAKAGPEGSRLWVKTRHLRFTDAPKV